MFLNIRTTYDFMHSEILKFKPSLTQDRTGQEGIEDEKKCRRIANSQVIQLPRALKKLKRNYISYKYIC